MHWSGNSDQNKANHVLNFNTAEFSIIEFHRDPLDESCKLSFAVPSILHVFQSDNVGEKE